MSADKGKQQREQKKRSKRARTDPAVPVALANTSLGLPPGFEEDTPLPISDDENEGPIYKGEVLRDQGELETEDEQSIEEIVSDIVDDDDAELDSGVEYRIEERERASLSDEEFEQTLQECGTPEDEREFLSDRAGEVIPVTKVFEFRKRYIQTYRRPPNEEKDIIEEVDAWLCRTEMEEYERGNLIRMIERKQREVAETHKKREKGDKAEMTYEDAVKYVNGMQLSMFQRKRLCKKLRQWIDTAKEAGQSNSDMIKREDVYDESEDYIYNRMNLRDFQKRELVKRTHSWIDETGRKKFYRDRMIEMIEELAKYV
jgi:hypothetical protein